MWAKLILICLFIHFYSIRFCPVRESQQYEALVKTISYKTSGWKNMIIFLIWIYWCYCHSSQGVWDVSDPPSGGQSWCYNMLKKKAIFLPEGIHKVTYENKTLELFYTCHEKKRSVVVITTPKYMWYKIYFSGKMCRILDSEQRFNYHAQNLYVYHC